MFVNNVVILNITSLVTSTPPIFAPPIVIVSAGAYPLPTFAIELIVSVPAATVILNTAPVPPPVLDFCGTLAYVPLEPTVPEP